VLRKKKNNTAVASVGGNDGYLPPGASRVSCIFEYQETDNRNSMLGFSLVSMYCCFAEEPQVNK